LLITPFVYDRALYVAPHNTGAPAKYLLATCKELKVVRQSDLTEIVAASDTTRSWRSGWRL